MRGLIGAGLALGALLLIAGLLAGLLTGVRQVDRGSRSRAVTNDQALLVELGIPREEVVRRLGPPLETADILAKEDCLVYRVEGLDSARGPAGEALDRWAFCFEAEELVQKSRVSDEEH